MDGEGRDPRTVQRGIDEAYACRDMVAAVPARPFPLLRATARFDAALLALRLRHRQRHEPAVDQRVARSPRRFDSDCAAPQS